jgi:hypothetical protein
MVIVAENPDRAAARARQPGDRIDRRRLAGAVGPEKAKKLAGVDSQRDAVDRGEATVPLDEAGDLDGCRPRR